MSKVKIKAGTTSYSTEIFVADTGSTTGAGLSTLTSATSGLIAEYRRRGSSSWTAITLVGSGGGKTLGTWTSGGFLSDGQGMYELDLPNAALAAGATGVFVRLYGAASMLMVMLEFELDAVDYQDATDFGLSTLDAAITSRMATFSLPTNFSSLSITGGGAVTAGTVSDKTGYSLSQSFPTNFASLSITGGGAVTAGTVSDKTGYSLSQAFPTNFSSLAITGGGAVTAGTVSDKTGYALTSDYDAAKTAASATNLSTAQTGITTLLTNTQDLPTMITGDGTAGAKFTVAALENAPGGSGGGGGLTTDEQTLLRLIAARSGVLGGSKEYASSTSVVQEYTIPATDMTDSGEILRITITKVSDTEQTFTAAIV